MNSAWFLFMRSLLAFWFQVEFAAQTSLNSDVHIPSKNAIETECQYKERPTSKTHLVFSGAKRGEQNLFFLKLA